MSEQPAAAGITAALAAAALAPVEDPAARDRAADLLLDYLAIAHRGGGAPAAQHAQEALLPGTSGDCRVEGADARTDARTATLLNGIAAHALELDDTYEPASLHPGVVVWPVVLALAETTGCSRDDMLDAAIAGYDVTCEVGDLVGAARAYARGFHPTGICGALGAATAAGRLLGLDATQLEHALGLAASEASGLLAFLTAGGWTKPLHAGHASACGLDAARLAGAGYEGPAGAVEGRFGVVHAFGGEQPASDAPAPDGAPAHGDGPMPGAAASTREGWRPRPAGWAVHATSVKFHPCCRYLHGNLDLLIELVREHRIVAVDVAAIRCAVLSAGWDLVAAPADAKREIRGQVDAQFSMPFGAARAVAYGAVPLAAFERAAAEARELGDLIARVECVRDAQLDAAFPTLWGGAVALELHDGTVLEARTPTFRGSPGQPADRAAIRAKATELLPADVVAALEARSASVVAR
ncbi:MAG TPA: MmgE/PrpD family protein [Conexibacter sp.]|jgi:2-methylcitrate dehydratase PrpD|nr:MmgE/PrpD family protein [Conexibacter sp.]